MHLRDYTYGELAGALKRAGIGTIASVVRLPSEATVFGMRFQPKASVAYLAYLRTMERFIGALATQAARRTMSRAAKLILFRSGTQSSSGNLVRRSGSDRVPASVFEARRLFAIVGSRRDADLVAEARYAAQA